MKKYIPLLIIISSTILTSCSDVSIKNVPIKNENSNTVQENTKNIQTAKTTPSTDTQVHKPIHYNSYTNSRCGYMLEYPDFLFQQTESDNGDWTTFNDKDGKEIMRVYCYSDIDFVNDTPINLKTQFQQEVLEFDSLMDHKMFSGGFLISWLKWESMTYKKIISKKDEDSMVNLDITFPKDQSSLYTSDVINVILSSLK